VRGTTCGRIDGPALVCARAPSWCCLWCKAAAVSRRIEVVGSELPDRAHHEARAPPTSSSATHVRLPRRDGDDDRIDELLANIGQQQHTTAFGCLETSRPPHPTDAWPRITEGQTKSIKHKGQQIEDAVVYRTRERKRPAPPSPRVSDDEERRRGRVWSFIAPKTRGGRWSVGRSPVLPSFFPDSKVEAGWRRGLLPRSICPLAQRSGVEWRRRAMARRRLARGFVLLLR